MFGNHYYMKKKTIKCNDIGQLQIRIKYSIESQNQIQINESRQSWKVEWFYIQRDKHHPSDQLNMLLSPNCLDISSYWTLNDTFVSSLPQMSPTVIALLFIPTNHNAQAVGSIIWKEWIIRFVDDQASRRQFTPLTVRQRGFIALLTRIQGHFR